MYQDFHLRQSQTVLSYFELEEIHKNLKNKLRRGKPGLPRIAVLLCGGTIWMDAVHKLRNDDCDQILVPLRLKDLDKRVNAQATTVFQKPFDSSNARWSHWVSVGSVIQKIYDDFDGFVVCFGTDTMAYLMAALHFILPNIGKPIIGVGSQTPMAQLGEDATRNLYFAVMAASGNLSGAHLAFNNKLMHGLHLHKIKGKEFDPFACPKQFILGEFTSDGVELYDRIPQRNSAIFSSILSFNPYFREGVKILPVSPGTPAESLLHDANDPLTHAILLIGLGAGNVRDTPLYDQEMTHIDVIRKLRERRFPVIIGNSMVDEPKDSPYDTGNRVLSPHIGAFPGGGASEVTLAVKIMYCLEKAWCRFCGGPVREQRKRKKYKKYKGYMGHREHLDYNKFKKIICENHVGELSKRGW